MFIFKNLNIEAKRRKLSLICESSEGKRTWLFPKIKLAKQSELVYFKNWQYRSEANRFDSEFVIKKTKKSELSFFFKTKGKKRKGSLVNYRSFAITRSKHPISSKTKVYSEYWRLWIQKAQEAFLYYLARNLSRNLEISLATRIFSTAFNLISLALC